MKKDLLIAVSIGITVGILIAIITINLPNIIKSGQVIKTSVAPPNIDISQNQKAPKLLSLNIDKPADNSISPISSIEISGNAKNGNLVVIDYPRGTKSAKVDKENKFLIKVDLTEGGNDIYITAYNDNFDTDTKMLTVFYTSEKL